MIVNADDLGYDEATNAAIVESLERGYCSSTTILANMPGFDDACRLAQENGLTGRVGVHLNVCEGMPLTEAIRGCPRFFHSDTGLGLRRDRRVLALSRLERDALAAELRAQAAACRQRGMALTHADSHRHAHEEWAIASVVLRVCREEGIPFLRLARNCGPARRRINRAYRRLLNARIARAGLARTRYFGSLADGAHLAAARHTRAADLPIEIMVHPVYDREGRLIDSTTERLLSEWDSELGLRGVGVSFAGMPFGGG